MESSTNSFTEEERETIKRLVDKRAKLRGRKRYEEADSIRKSLRATHRVVLEESSDGTTRWYTEVEFMDAKRRKTEECRRQQRLKHFKMEEGSTTEMPQRNRNRMNRKVNAHRKKQKQRFAAFHQFLCDEKLLLKPSQSDSTASPLVLDICGGNGSLSWEIVRGQMNNVCSVVVDPMCMRLTRFKSTLLVKEALGKSNNSAEESVGQSVFPTDGNVGELKCSWLHPKVKATILNDCDLNKVKKHYTEIGFGKQFCGKFDSSFSKETVNETCAKLWENADLVLGLHPDQATDDIVEMSLTDKKVFAVVPCCVFPKLFPNRILRDGSRVKTHPQLVKYLLEKAEDFLGKGLLGKSSSSTPNCTEGKKYVVSSTVVENMPGPCNICIYGKYVENDVAPSC
jgi:hypothetical protein